VAPPIVDSTNHVLYEFYGDNSADTAAEVAQVVFTSSPSFSSSSTTSLSSAGTNKAAFLTTTAGVFPITDGAFSQSYFGTFDSTTSFLYACGAAGTGTGFNGATLQQFQFSSTHTGILSTTVTTVNPLLANGSGSQSGNLLCSPLTEFYNTNGTPTDYLFLNVPGASSPHIVSFNITNNTAGGPLTSTTGTTTLVNGTSGIIVDGQDPLANASSLYFTSRGPGTCTTSGTNGTQANPANTGIGSVASAVCAYKLTQNGLD
jgi:hypothetical protein